MAGSSTAPPSINVEPGVQVSFLDPAIRIVVKRGNEVTVAVYRGRATVTIGKEAIGKEDKRELEEGKEVRVDLQLREVQERPARFSKAEEDAFLRLARNLDIPVPPTPAPTPCPALANLSLRTSVDTITSQVTATWTSSGGCPPFSGTLTARYTDQPPPPYKTYTVATQADKQTDIPPLRCEGNFTIQYEIILADRTGQKASASTTASVKPLC